MHADHTVGPKDQELCIFVDEELCYQKFMTDYLSMNTVNAKLNAFDVYKRMVVKCS